MLYHADPAWEEPPEVRAMLQSGESDSEPLYEDEVRWKLLDRWDTILLHACCTAGWFQ